MVRKIIMILIVVLFEMLKKRMILLKVRLLKNAEEKNANIFFLFLFHFWLILIFKF